APRLLAVSAFPSSTATPMPRPDATIGNPEHAPSYIRMPRFPSPSPRLLRTSPAAGPRNPNPLRRVDPARPALSATSRQRWPPAIHLRPPHTRSPPGFRCRPQLAPARRRPAPPGCRGQPQLSRARRQPGPPGQRGGVGGDVWRSWGPPNRARVFDGAAAPAAATRRACDEDGPGREHTVVPMPLRELVMTLPLQGRPVMAPLPFPRGPPSMMAPPSFYDVASPMTVQQPPHAGYMMGQPLLRASPPPMAALHLPQAVQMVAQPPLPAGPPPLKRHRPDYFGLCLLLNALPLLD
uniref:Uncharacterized protein n=1 Tax=Aegilops tauschii subsp. strangulata TaxID=200361 RepID=A0A453LDK9_AEGTS